MFMPNYLWDADEFLYIVRDVEDLSCLADEDKHPFHGF